MGQSCRRGHKVAPLSTDKIRDLAGMVRRGIGAPVGKINIHHLLEYVLPQLIEGFTFEVSDSIELGTAEAVTWPDQKRIVVHEDVYRDLTEGGTRARFTIAHEIGHLFLHQGADTILARDNSSNHKVYEDSEWQADTFAAEFLMPYEECRKCLSAHDIMQKFGVGYTAASIRFNSIK